MNFLPLGSIIKVNGHKVCIIGYGAVDKDKTSVGGYFVVSYPLGFIGIDKTFFIPHNEEFEVLAEGYKTESSEKVLEVLAKSFQMVADVPTEEVMKISEALKELKKKEASET